jgi:hypothetical protein
MRVKLPFALAVILVLAGTLIDCSYQRSTPDAAYVQGTVVGFYRPHASSQRARIDTRWFNHPWVIGGIFVALALVFGALTQRESKAH